MTARAQIDAQFFELRALHVAAFIALIEENLSHTARIMPRAECAALIESFVRTGHASVSHSGGADCLTMLSIQAGSSGTAYGLLRNWQIEAQTYLARGQR